MDFVHDHLATGREIRVLTVVDTFSRFSPAVDARFSYKGEDVVQTLNGFVGNLVTRPLFGWITSYIRNASPFWQQVVIASVSRYVWIMM